MIKIILGAAAMSYSSARKRRTKQRILESAYRLFAAKGFGATSIEEIMRDCSLTPGGFYAHFRSKSQLHRDAMSHAASHGRLWGSASGEGAVGSSIESVLSEYLDTRQLKFFAADVASEEPQVRSAYTDAFKTMSGKISGCATSCGEGSILSMTAMIIGTLAVVQTTDDPDLRTRLLASCKENAKALLENRSGAPLNFFWEPAAN
jgi:TetR/AcrR family transcriptional repressor of nem operon